jgi:endonuclease/exonuclease/phosphatase family metal-dependent hydrolase
MRLTVMTYNVHGLPWSKNQSAEIVRYISAVRPDVLSLQEVFTDVLRRFFSDSLTALGYTVVSPRDEGVTFIGCGLLTAFLSSKLRLVSSCFYPFTVYHNLEIGANKGFHTVRLEDTEGRRVLLLNTHTQSDTLFSGFGFVSDVPTTRKAQFAEMVRWLEKDRDPVVLLGDMNCETSPHPHIRFLNDSVARKSTFEKTGEDIDHVAWIPTQWAPMGTSWCGFPDAGIKAVKCRVDPVPYSDHFPVVVDLVIPDFRLLVQGECGSIV